MWDTDKVLAQKKKPQQVHTSWFSSLLDGELEQSQTSQVMVNGST